MSTGQRVLANVKNIDKPGVVRYVGLTKFSTGTWFGVELDEPGERGQILDNELTPFPT